MSDQNTDMANQLIGKSALKLASESGLAGRKSKILSLFRLGQELWKSVRGQQANLSMDHFKAIFGEHMNTAPKEVLEKFETIISAANQNQISGASSESVDRYRNEITKLIEETNAQHESKQDFAARTANARFQVCVEGALGFAAEEAGNADLAADHHLKVGRFDCESDLFEKMPQFIARADHVNQVDKSMTMNDKRYEPLNFVKAKAKSMYENNDYRSLPAMARKEATDLDQTYKAMFKEAFDKEPKDKITMSRVISWFKKPKRKKSRSKPIVTDAVG